MIFLKFEKGGYKMSFCTQCGAKQVEGEVHQCPVQSGISQQTIAREQTATTFAVPIVTPSWGDLNIHQIMSLMKNPFASVELSVETGFRYGVLGFFACVLGIFLWFSAVYNNLTSGIINLFGLGNVPSLASGLSIDRFVQLNYVKDLFIVILIMALYFAAVYLFSNWMGDSKRDLKHVISVLGSTQWTASIGFLIAAIFSFVSIPVSLGAFLIVFATNAIIVFLVSLEFFGIATSNKVGFLALSITANIIISGLILQYFFKTEFISMINIAFKTNYFSFSDISSEIMQNILRGL
jgi:hypothetical protein